MNNSLDHLHHPASEPRFGFPRSANPGSRSLPIVIYVASAMLALLSLAMASADAQEAKKVVQDLQGTWKVAKIESSLDKQPSDEAKAKEEAKAKQESIRLVFTDNKLTTRVEDRVADESTFTLDPTKSPKWIDTVLISGPNKGETAEGIYELHGDDLKICIGPPGQKRPAKFKVTPSEAGVVTEVMLFLKREKP